MKEYMRDVDGCEQIDLAMDAILKEKLNTRKKSKGLKRKNLRQKKEEEDYTPPFVERIKNQFEKPDKTTLMRRAVLYFGISIWSIVTPCVVWTGVSTRLRVCRVRLLSQRQREADKRDKSAWKERETHFCSYESRLVDWFDHSGVHSSLPESRSRLS